MRDNTTDSITAAVSISVQTDFHLLNQVKVFSVSEKVDINLPQ